MGNRFRFAGTVFFLSLALAAPLATALRGAEAIREVDLAVSALVYDPFTAKLYGARTNNLLQIDPDSGQVLNTFNLGSRIARLELGAGNGLWAAVDHALRRFNLQTLTAEDPIPIVDTAFDLSPSQSEPYTVAFSTPRISGRWEAAWLVKNGVILPGTAQGFYVAVNGNYYFEDNLRFAIGPNGIVQAGYVGVPTWHPSRMKPFGSYIYQASGGFWEINTLEPAVPQSNGAWSTFTINRAENALYYLTDHNTEWHLNRHEPITFKHTGHYRLPNYDPNPIAAMPDRYIAAWGTNRAAFHTSSKLFLLDTAQLFVPADVSVTQTANPSANVGETYAIRITVTNQGPGAALNVAFVDTLTAGIVLGTGQQIQVDPHIHPSVFSANFGVLQPGQSTQFDVTVFPTEALTATNVITISSDNDPNAANNSSQVSISILHNSDRVTELPIPAADLAYDPLNKRLFIGSGGVVWAYDPADDEIHLSTSAHNAITRLEVPDTGGSLYVLAAGGFFYKYDPQTLVGTRIPAPTLTIHDFALSPTNPDLQVFSEARGTYLFQSGAALPNSVPPQGTVAFSADGTRVYLQDPNCLLSVLNVGESGLTLEVTRSNVVCGDFTVLGDLLYFHSGLIYNPATGVAAANSFNLTPPSYVVPRSTNHIDVLNRTNGAWAVRRLSVTNLQTIRTVPIDPSHGTPLEMIALEPNTVAVRTDAGVVLVVDLGDRGDLTVSLAFAPNQVTVSFFSVAGQNYRIERTDTLINPTWTTVRDNIAGNGGRIDEIIPTTTGTASFYRVVRL
jgi:uncharacterized repeat protein (TIGR01451 family)